MSWAVSYHLYTDNFFQYKDNNPISVFDARWQGCFSPSSKFTVTPSFYGRVLSGSGNYPFAIINMVGGTIPGRYMPQQIPFTGINRAELSQAALLVAGLNLRQRILKTSIYQ